MNLRRNVPLVLLSVGTLATLVILVFVFGNLPIIPYTFGESSVPEPISRFDITNRVILFDESLVHSIQVILPPEDFQQMIDTYLESGEKAYFQADVIIDGVRINRVGIRLKGNASLRSALGGGGGMAPGNRLAAQERGEGLPPADGEAQPEGQRPGMPGADGRPEPPAGAESQALPDRPQPPDGFPGAGPAMGSEADNATSGNEQTKIPFMIKFDEYVEDQTYQGYQAIAIRAYGTRYDEALLHEPVTNTIARLVDLPAPQTAYTAFSLNQGDETLYVITELIDETYLAQYFEQPDGILYKAEIGSTLQYQGENTEAYADLFSQQTRRKDVDLTPLIDFMRFLDQADEATFERDLPQWLDVDQFATYLALNNLLVNTDSLIGMNNNYYLYYDESNQRFSLLLWDTNESLAKMGNNASFDLYFHNTGGGRGVTPGGMVRGENTLLKRFMASETFKALYEAKIELIYQRAFTDHALNESVQGYADLIYSTNPTRGLVDLQAYDQAVGKVLTFIEQRGAYLAGTELLGSVTTSSGE